MSNPPEVAVWLSLPDDCSMRGEFEAGDHDFPDIHIMFGSRSDDKNLLFERNALERFVQLAQRMLAVPVTPDGPTPTTRLVSNHGYAIREEPPTSAVA